MGLPFAMGQNEKKKKFAVIIWLFIVFDGFFRSDQSFKNAVFDTLKRGKCQNNA